MTSATLKGEFRSIRPEQSQIILIEAGPRILSSFSEKLSRDALKTLEGFGVSVLVETKVTNIQASYVEIEKNGVKETINTESVLWGAGVKPSLLANQLKKEFSCSLDR